MEDVFFSSSAKHYQDGKRNVIPGNVNKIILLFISLCCALEINAQIKVQHEYEYICNQTNNAGLRVVGNYFPTGWRNNQEFKYGCIDKEGNEIIPLSYKKIIMGKDYPYILAIVNNNSSQDLYSEDGKQCYIKGQNISVTPKLHKKYRCAVVGSKNIPKLGVMNYYSEMIVPAIYNDLFWIDEDKGYLAAQWNDKWSIIDYRGKELRTLKYKNVGEGVNGILLVENSMGKWGAVDLNDKVIIPFNYSSLHCFDGWTMWASQNGKHYALISAKGKKLTNFEYNRKNSWIGWDEKKIHNVITNWTGNKKSKVYYFDDNGKIHSTSEEAIVANRSIRMIVDDNKSKLANLTWINNDKDTKKQNYELSILIKSDSRIEDVSIDVNGIQDRGIKTVNSSDYDLTINRTLMLNEGANVIKVSVRNAAGTTQEEKTIVYRPQVGELPSIEWLDFAATANKKEYQMKLGIKSKSKVEEVNVTVNGSLTRGIKTVEADGYDLTVDRTLALSEGINRIVVSVRNGDGISTSEKVITYQGNNPIPVFNDKRIAFVVGNSHYSNSEMNLANPENDAKDVAEKLKSLGFEVVLKLDATLETMDKELSAFGGKARDYDVALFYYAGHGIQSKGVNYIIPTNIDNLAEDNMKYKCVDMERVLDVMEDSHCKLKIVILDACRNDPLSRRWHRSAGTRGLSIMNAPTGTIISFSTSPGSTALDGTGRNSPYTQAFLNTLDLPNLDVFHFFQKVGASVLEVTKKEQNPWLSVSFTGDFYFNKQQ